LPFLYPPKLEGKRCTVTQGTQQRNEERERPRQNESERAEGKSARAY